MKVKVIYNTKLLVTLNVDIIPRIGERMSIATQSNLGDDEIVDGTVYDIEWVTACHIATHVNVFIK